VSYRRAEKREWKGKENGRGGGTEGSDGREGRNQASQIFSPRSASALRHRYEVFLAINCRLFLAVILQAVQRVV